MSDARQKNEGVRSQMLFEANRKSVGVAYLLWFFLGMFGAHRFYLGETGTAVAQLLLLIVGAVLTIVLIGFLLLGVLGVWVLLDAVLIPGIVRRHNIELADRLTR